MILAWLLAAVPAWAASDYPLPPAPAAVSTATTLGFSADHLDYDASSSTLHFQGHVRIVDSTRTIKAQELWLDTSRRSGRFQGTLLVEDGASAVAGQSGWFNFNDRTGVIEQASAGHGNWRIHARRARLSASRRLDYLSANFTSCDYVPPHYHFHASRVTIKPRRYLLALNTVFFLGPVPLLYLPILYEPLNLDHLLPLRFQLGYDRRNGALAKGTMIRRLDRWTYDKLYLDYYKSQGLGLGSELERRKGENRSVLYGYQIRETSTGKRRWTLIGDGYQTLRSSFSVQGRLQLQSDPAFNNDYSRSSLLRVTPELIDNGALVYRQKLYTMRLSYSRHATASDNQTQFVKDSEDAPRFDFQTAPLGAGRLPWLNTLTAFADNNYTAGRSFLQRSAGGGWEGTRVFVLGKGLSLTPKLDAGETWFDTYQQAADFASTDTYRDSFVGRYAASGDLRWSGRLGDWDLEHDYAVRLKPDSVSRDAGALDRGVETNLLSLRDLYRPSPAVLLRASSGYDFRTARDRSFGYSDRVQPVVGELDYAAGPSVNWSLRDDFQPGIGQRSVLGSLLYGREDRSYVSAAFGYTRAVSDRYGLDTSFALSNGSGTWRIAATLRSEFFAPGGPLGLAADRSRLFEKELILTKVWHDFFTRLLVRFRPGNVREAQLRVNLRFGHGRRAAPRRDWEAEWFPERATGDYDRP